MTFLFGLIESRMIFHHRLTVIIIAGKQAYY